MKNIDYYWMLAIGIIVLALPPLSMAMGTPNTINQRVPYAPSPWQMIPYVPPQPSNSQ